MIQSSKNSQSFDWKKFVFCRDFLMEDKYFTQFRHKKNSLKIIGSIIELNIAL
jgi:hypothetical protein